MPPTPPASNGPADNDHPLVYTLNTLNRETGRIISKIEETGQPAFITKHGRFVVIITPLTPGLVESSVLAAMAHKIATENHH